MNFIKNLYYTLLNKQISSIYKDRFYKYHNTPKGVFWNNRISQDLRLNIILDKITDNSLLNIISIGDVGCGYGRLFEIIKERKNNSRLRWINETMVNVARYGGTSLLMDFNMPVIASPRFLEQMKPKALNPNNYIGLEETSGIFKLMQGSLSANWDLDWSKINVPVLIMTGHHDKVFRVPSDIDDIIKTMKNTKRIELEDCGHLIPIEKPQEFADYINKFVKNLT